MAHWLYKSEPDVWSWDQQVARGDAGEHWNGVRNYLARKHLQAMKTAILAFSTIPTRARRLSASSRSSGSNTPTTPMKADVSGWWISRPCGR